MIRKAIETDLPEAARIYEGNSGSGGPSGKPALLIGKEENTLPIRPPGKHF